VASEDRKRVVVAMSGGVDSSVAAALLVEAGYSVIGITMKTYAYESVGGNSKKETTCCSLESIEDARSVASKLGFPHYVLDLSPEFENHVIDNFVAEYLAGRTPNPCIICNKKIKWEELLRKADGLGAEFIATGHYASIRFDQTLKRSVLSKGKDRTKDQSYALWALSQDSLRRTLFPLAGYTKTEVRSLAGRFGLDVASKGESFEICFVPDNNYARFIKERVAGLEKQLSDGEIVVDGKIVGRHEGYPFYTIGQRRGLGISSADPLYITAIDPHHNRITLGSSDDLLHQGLTASQLNMIKYVSIGEQKKYSAKIRYKDPGSPASVRTQLDGTLEVLFDEPKRAVTPGQSVVLYEDDDVVGGGIIDYAIPQVSSEGKTA
jgi:tRNA-uridine 2-sulfurtransferase